MLLPLYLCYQAFISQLASDASGARIGWEVARFADARVRLSVRRTHDSIGWNVRNIRDFAGQHCHSPARKGSAQDGGQFHRPGGRDQGIYRRNDGQETEEKLL